MFAEYTSKLTRMIRLAKARSSFIWLTSSEKSKSVGQIIEEHLHFRGYNFCKIFIELAKNDILPKK